MRRNSASPGAASVAVLGVLLGTLLGTLLGACGGTTSPSTTAHAGSRPATTQPTAMTLAFTRPDGTLGEAQRNLATGSGSAAPPRAALLALIAGPDANEEAAGFSTEVPGSTKVDSLTVDSGQATLDIGRGFVSATGAVGPTALPTAVAQIVFTLTQFSSVQQVAFRVDGVLPSSADQAAGLPAAPVTRTDEFRYLPPIFVEQPAANGPVSDGELRIQGLADVFEAQFQVQLVDAGGNVVIDETVHASAGSGTWGEFDTKLPFTTSHFGAGKLIVFAVSAKDGSRIDEVVIPVTVITTG